MVFLDQLDYDKTLTYKGVQYHAMWHRIFVPSALRKRFPAAKYNVQMDDDILVLYKETRVLNHYINKMEADPEVEIIFGEEGGGFMLNDGMFVMKNHDFAFKAYRIATEIGLENNNR